MYSDAGNLFTEVSSLSERVKPNSSSRLAELERRLSDELCLPIDQLLCACKEKAIQASVVDVENQIEMQYLWMKQKLANIHRASSMQ